MDSQKNTTFVRPQSRQALYQVMLCSYLLQPKPPTLLHVSPSNEYEIVFVPCPPASHIAPFHPTQNAIVVNGCCPIDTAVQFLPSNEVASPTDDTTWPAATHIVPFHATLRTLPVVPNGFVIAVDQVLPSDEYSIVGLVPPPPHATNK